MTGRTVLIPWRPTGPERCQALRWITDRWADAGWQVRLCEDRTDRPWCKARALAAHIADAGDPIVVADADVWAYDIAQAVAEVEAGAPWAIPHGQVYRLTRAVSAAVETTPIVPPAETVEELPVERHPYQGVAGGGLVVVRRHVALDTPMDGLFEGWGGEDDAWGRALTTMWGDPWRSTLPLIHLHHPHAAPDRPAPHIGNMDSEARRRRYFAALNDKPRMRALLEEGRLWPQPSN